MIEIMFVIIEVVLLLIFLSIFYDSKKRKSSIIFIFIIIILIYLTNILMNATLNAIVNFIVYVILAMVLYEGQILNKLFLIVMFYTLSILSDFLTNYIMQNIFNVNLAILLSNKRYFLYSNILSKLFVFVFLALINFIKRRNDVSIQNANKYALSLAILPISCLFILFGIIDLLDNVVRLNILVYIGVCGFVISTIYVYYLFNRVLWSDIKNKELEYLKEMNKLNSQYYKIQVDNYNSKKALVHDIKKHIMYIAFAIENKEFNMLKKYMDELKVSTFFIDKNYTGVKVFDIVVNARMEDIKANQIRLKFDIDKNICFSKMELVDQNILFSNLLDNCIENTCKVDTKFVSVKMRKMDNDFILLKFMNTFDSELSNDDYTDLKTTKQDSENHGFGTKIILRIVKKYNGELYSEIGKNNSLFIVSIIFNTSYV